MGDYLGNGLQRYLGEGLGMRNRHDRILNGIIRRIGRALAQQNLDKADNLFMFYCYVLKKKWWNEALSHFFSVPT